MGESDKEIVEALDRAVAEGRELEGYERAPGMKTSKNLSVTYGIRLSQEEYRRFAEAAKAHGMSLADLMRTATRAVLADEQDLNRAEAEESVRAMATAMDQARVKLASIAASLGMRDSVVPREEGPGSIFATLSLTGEVAGLAEDQTSSIATPSASRPHPSRGFSGVP